MIDKRLLAKELMIAANFYGKVLNQQMLELWVIALKDLEPNIIRGLSVRIVNTFKWMPSPAEVIERYNFKDNLEIKAHEMSLRLMGCIRTYGRYDYREHYDKLSDLEKEVIRLSGGWRKLIDVEPEREHYAMKDLSKWSLILLKQQKVEDEVNRENSLIENLSVKQLE